MPKMLCTQVLSEGLMIAIETARSQQCDVLPEDMPDGCDDVLEGTGNKASHTEIPAFNPSLAN
jgi:hypothetical protein